MKFQSSNLTICIPTNRLVRIKIWLNKWEMPLAIAGFVALSISYFSYFYFNGLGLAYNDARSHLDIGRRVVEGLTPGFAQIGSVWLPLPHILMIPTIWQDWFWHSGMSGSIQSMLAFVACGYLIYIYLSYLKVDMVGRWFSLVVFVANLNILYLQSTAMTELLLLSTLTAAAYYFLKWCDSNEILSLVGCAFWVMMASLIRYEGWFLLLVIIGLIIWKTWREKNWKTTEGTIILFGTLAGFGIVLWLRTGVCF